MKENAGMQEKNTGGANDELSQVGNLSVKRTRTEKILAFIACFIAAFFIWYYAADHDTAIFEESFSSVPVEIVNGSGFSVLSGSGVTVDVTVSGKRNVLKKLKKQDIRAFIDMSSVTAAGRYKFDLQYELPNGVTLAKSSSDSLSVYCDNTSTVTVPVKVELKNYRFEHGYEIGTDDITTDVSGVIVTGPESVVSTVEAALLKIDFEYSVMTNSVTYKGGIILVNKDGTEVTNAFIKTNITDVTANIPVYKYRDVPITVKYRYGYFNSENVTVKAEPATVRVRGEADAVDAVTLEFELDEKKTDSDTSYTMSISLPDGVKNVDSVKTAVVSVELRGISTKNISVYNISVTNPDGLTYEPVTGPINIQVRGDSVLLGRLSPVHVTAVVDLSFSGEVSGTVMVPVSFIFSAPFERKVYEVGTYSVSVRIGASD